jgi:hypothetical protein
VIAKVSDTLAPRRSVAVTLARKLPTSPLTGTPENRRVAGSKVSQAGSAEPSESVAEYLSASPGVASENAVAGTWKSTAPSSCTVTSTRGFARTGAEFSCARSCWCESVLPSKNW